MDELFRFLLLRPATDEVNKLNPPVRAGGLVCRAGAPLAALYVHRLETIFVSGSRSCGTPTTWNLDFPAALV